MAKTTFYLASLASIPPTVLALILAGQFEGGCIEGEVGFIVEETFLGVLLCGSFGD